MYVSGVQVRDMCLRVIKLNVSSGRVTIMFGGSKTNANVPKDIIVLISLISIMIMKVLVSITHKSRWYSPK